MQWIENRLQELAGIFALDVAGYAVLDNHLHVILKLNGKSTMNVLVLPTLVLPAVRICPALKLCKPKT